jgi:hypothetical protein
MDCADQSPRRCHIIKEGIFDPVTYFKEFHSYQQLDSTDGMTLQPTLFWADYGFGTLQYQYEIHDIVFLSRIERLSYRVAREVLTQDQIKKLKHYCSCKYHRTPSFFQWLRSYKPLACIERDPSQNDINQARDKLSKKKEKLSIF